MRLRITRWLGAATIALAMLAFPAGQAVAGGSPITITIQSDAPLQPDGSVLLTFTYSCFPGFVTDTTGQVSTDVEQPQAYGVNGGTVVCDDKQHTMTLDQSPGPFLPGEAASGVEITVGAGEVNYVQSEVNVVKR